MLEKSKFTVSASPHVRGKATVRGIMLDVIIALVPSLIAGIIIFGPRAIMVTAVSVLVCLLSEYLTNKAFKRPNTLGDLSAVVTGILLAMNMPVTIPYWMLAIGAVVAIVVVKQFFGGIGQNFVNPALAGRIVMLMSFSGAMTNFPTAFAWRNSADAVTSATPLAQLGDVNSCGFLIPDINVSQSIPSFTELFFGMHSGSIGEVCSVAILLGFIYLVARRVIGFAIPLSFVGSFALIMLIAGRGNLNYMLYHILSGGLLLGAVFMATDYSTSPIGTRGKIIFGIGCGVVTAVIRLFGSLPEGVSYAILMMNVLVPLIERIALPKPFGTEKQIMKKAEEAAS